MTFLEPIYGGGLADEINRICGSTATTYPNKDKVARINDAIDKYFFLGNYQFEDSNQSVAPIETIDLVSGTSRYALGDLTSELLNFLRVEITDSDGNDRVIYPNRLSNIIDAYDEYYSDNATPVEYFKIGKYIDLKPAPNYDATGGLTIYFDRPASKYTFVTCTTTFASDLINATAHGLAAGDAVIFETDNNDAPSGITVDKTVYYVIASGLTDDVFKVSTTIGGSTITIADDGTGNHKFLKVSGEPGVPSIHHQYLARKASLPFLVEKKLPQMNSIAQLIQQDESDIKQFFSQRNKDERKIAIMSPINFR